MLTVDHTKLSRRKGVVEVVPLCGLARDRARELCDIAVDIVRAHEGEPRAALEEALEELPVSHVEVRFGRGLAKLCLDACTFDVDTELDPEELRAAVFLAAASARKETPGADLDRARVIDAVAAERAVTAEEVERALFADLSAAHAVRGFDVVDGGQLVDSYAHAEVQAVLLRATRLTVDVDGSATEARALLRAVKFHQLLFELDESKDGVHLVVEGPMALFQQSTRYGLKLALLYPHVLACARFRLEADVRLRKGSATVEKFVVAGERRAPSSPGAHGASPPGPPQSLRSGGHSASAGPTDIAAALVDEIGALDAAGTSAWRASHAAAEVLRVPGAGSFVPDLRLEHKETGEIVFVEILGFWSRDAVWRRVELVEKGAAGGLPFRAIFCASDRLRVSERALDDDAPSALVVFKGVLRAAKVLEAASRIITSGAARAAPPR